MWKSIYLPAFGPLQTYLLREKQVTLYLRLSFPMMYPQGPELYTQCFPEQFGGGDDGGGGGDFVG